MPWARDQANPIRQNETTTEKLAYLQLQAGSLLPALAACTTFSHTQTMKFEAHLNSAIAAELSVRGVAGCEDAAAPAVWTCDCSCRTVACSSETCCCRAPTSALFCGCDAGTHGDIGRITIAQTMKHKPHGRTTRALPKA